MRGIPLSNVSTTVFCAQQIHIWVPHDGRGGDVRREDHRYQGVILRKSVLAVSVLTGITTLTPSGACSMESHEQHSSLHQTTLQSELCRIRRSYSQNCAGPCIAVFTVCVCVYTMSTCRVVGSLATHYVHG